MSNTRIFTVMLLVTLTASVCMAQTIASDSFEKDSLDTPAKLTDGQGFDGDWKLRGKGARDVAVVEQSLRYEKGDIKINGGSKALQYKASDPGILVFATRELPEQKGPLYLSFLFEQTQSKGNSNDFFQVGFDAGKSTAPNASIVAQSQFFPRANSAPAKTDPAGKVAVGQVTLLVVKLDKSKQSPNYDAVTIFVDPTSSDETANKSAAHKQNCGVSHVSRLVLRKAFTEPGDTFLIDAIRIGTSFKNVVE